MKYPDKLFLVEYLSNIFFSQPTINNGNNCTWCDDLGFTIKEELLDDYLKFTIEREDKLLVSCIIDGGLNDIVFLNEYRLSPEDEIIIRMSV